MKMRKGEQGVALVFTLFLMAAMSAMAVSLMFLAQTETSASRNYRTMSQARYAGEAGVHRVLNYLSSPVYEASASLTGLDTSVSPVTYNSGQPVVLRAVGASNHPVTTIKDAYSALFASPSLTVGTGATVTYTATATLLSARQVIVYGGSPRIVETWRIDAVGTVPGTQPATVEVSGIMERNSAPAETYAIFATGSDCGAIEMLGDVHTDSYDSSPGMPMSGGHPTTVSSGGSVGTNGNLSIKGNVQVNGNLDTPRTGVGDCTAGAVTAQSSTGHAEVTGDTIKLPQEKKYPTPEMPWDAVPPMAPTPGVGSLTVNAGTLCAEFAVPSGVICGKSGSSFTLTVPNGVTITLPNVSLTAGTTLTINGVGTNPSINLNVNSFSMGGNSTLVLGATTSVVMKVAGKDVPTTQAVVDFTGGSLTNASYDPSRFQIIYGGAGTIKAGGGSDTAATVYAPNAFVDMYGNAGFYGSVLSNRFKDNGGASMHYDRRLATLFTTLGSYVLTSFSWQKY